MHVVNFTTLQNFHTGISCTFICLTLFECQETLWWYIYGVIYEEILLNVKLSKPSFLVYTLQVCWKWKKNSSGHQVPNRFVPHSEQNLDVSLR